MEQIQYFFLAYPFSIWLIIGVLLLAAEIATGTGWLLWPAASAGMLALMLLAGIDLGWAGDIIVFALLTIATTIGVRHLSGKRNLVSGPDINDRNTELLGKTGHAVGSGRVMVDGAEWDAEVEGDALLAPGMKIQVTRVLGGAKLAVKRIMN